MHSPDGAGFICKRMIHLYPFFRVTYFLKFVFAKRSYKPASLIFNWVNFYNIAAF